MCPRCFKAFFRSCAAQGFRSQCCGHFGECVFSKLVQSVLESAFTSCQDMLVQQDRGQEGPANRPSTFATYVTLIYLQLFNMIKAMAIKLVMCTSVAGLEVELR